MKEKAPVPLGAALFLTANSELPAASEELQTQNYLL
jgi:hypothetical protein